MCPLRTTFSSMGKKTILFIEDEGTLQKAAQEILSQQAYDVLSAFDGEKGVVMAQEKRPDLILLDLILPKKDGFQVLAALKADKITKEIPVIVLTNLEGVGDVDKALALGATTYLVKANYSLGEIAEKIRETLGQ